MVCAVTFERHGRLYYADPGALTPADRRARAVPDRRRRRGGRGHVGAAVGQRGRRRAAGAGRRWPATPTSSGRPNSRRRRARARVAAKRLIREHDLPMKVSGIDYVDADDRTIIYFTAAAPGRLPGARPRPVGHAARPGRTAPAVGARRGPADRRARLVRARAVLLDVPGRLRAGVGADGQGPGPAAEPAADLGRVRAADVLPEVRAPAVSSGQRDLGRGGPARRSAPARPTRPPRHPQAVGRAARRRGSPARPNERRG